MKEITLFNADLGKDETWVQTGAYVCNLQGSGDEVPNYERQARADGFHVIDQRTHLEYYSRL